LPVHSLWLVPDRRGPEFAKLRRLIEDLAERFGTPIFDPHVTLVGGVEGTFESISVAAERLLLSLPSCELALREVVSRSSYFQRLVAPVELTPELTWARLRALAAFAVEEPDYWPHLSLAYGDLDEGGSQQLLAAAVAANVAGMRFAAARLEAWRTEREVAEWAPLIRYELPPGRGR
jgi:hypothetical protein